MMKEVLLAAAVLIGAIVPVYATEWLCVPELSTGFSLESGEWVRSAFTVKGESIIVAEVTGKRDYLGEPYGIEVTHTGDEFPMHTCPPLSEGMVQVACGNMGYGFLFNKSTLRFQEYYGIGFVDGRDDGGNTPSLTIGHCSKLPERTPAN